MTSSRGKLFADFSGSCYLSIACFRRVMGRKEIEAATGGKGILMKVLIM